MTETLDELVLKALETHPLEKLSASTTHHRYYRLWELTLVHWVEYNEWSVKNSSTCVPMGMLSYKTSKRLLKVIQQKKTSSEVAEVQSMWDKLLGRNKHVN